MLVLLVSFWAIFHFVHYARMRKAEAILAELADYYDEEPDLCCPACLSHFHHANWCQLRPYHT